MSWVRIGISLLAIIVGAFFALILFAFNGYEEDAGSGVVHTLWLAIPIAVGTATVAVLTAGALFSPERRRPWSLWALGVVLAEILIVFVVLFLNLLSE